MENKFTIDDLMIRILPGGSFIAALFFIFQEQADLILNDRLDFLYTFLFFCSAFILGELFQTIAHLFEKSINVFFKFRKPSEVFLYTDNPVIKNKKKREEILNFLSLSKAEEAIFDKQYSELEWCPCSTRNDNDLSQSIFWTLYSNVKENEDIKLSNRNYLFVRVITLQFLILSITLLVMELCLLGLLSFVVFGLFFWRTRGVARGLVFSVVLRNLKDKTG